MTKIEWADEVWNPVVGCSVVSPGCDHCYAVPQSRRNAAMGRPEYEGLTRKRPTPEGASVERRGSEWTGVVRCLDDRLNTPAKWKSPRRIFVNSMSDLFHPDVPQVFIAQVFASMSIIGQHIYQVLTKRPQRMEQIVGSDEFLRQVDDFRGAAAGDFTWPLPNVWLGTSVETQRYADLRIPHLLGTPAAVHFISAEPLLGHIDLSYDWLPVGYANRTDYGTGVEYDIDRNGALDWVIVGGESGPGARPMHPDWPRWLRDQCTAASVAYLFKQWGQFAPYQPEQRPLGNGVNVAPDGSYRPVGEWPAPGAALMRSCGKREAGRELDGRTWDQFPP